jgi:MFS family permease
MSLLYAMTAYPFGKLSDVMNRKTMLVIGLIVLIAADVVLAIDGHWWTVLVGVSLWGIHMGMTQGLLSTLVADTAPVDLRGTAFGVFNLISGVAMLLASVTAGLIWDQFGASYTFVGGAVFALLAITGVLAWRQPAK